MLLEEEGVKYGLFGRGVELMKDWVISDAPTYYKYKLQKSARNVGFVIE